MIISTAIENYLVYYRASGHSQSSINTITNSLGKLLSYSREQNWGSLDDLNPTRMDEWVTWMMDSGSSPASIRLRVSVVKTFLRWCVERGYVADVTSIPVPKMHRKQLQDLLSNHDLDVLLAFLKDGLKTRNADRDRAIVLTFLATGLRLHELVALKIEDVDCDRGTATITGKGSKTRTVCWLPSGACGKALRKVIGKRKYGPVFVKTNGDPLTQDGVQVIMKRIGAMIDIKIDPHMLRRTWCSQSVASGMPAHVVMNLGGWSDLSVVSRYLHLATDQQIVLAQKFARF